MNTIQMQRVGFKTIFREKEFCLLLLIGILYFYRPLFMGETFFFRDLSLFAVPQKQRLVDFLNSGELPLWDPYLQGGQSYLGQIANSALYPFNLLYFFLPLLKAFNLSIVLHFLLSSGSVYCFSRILGLQPLSAFISGVIYGFCGYTLSLANLPGLFFNIPYLPLLFLFWHLFLLEKKKKWFVISVIVGLFQALTGSHEPNAMAMLSLLGWTLFYPYSPYTRHVLFRRSILWIVLGLFIIGTASVQIFPTIEMLFQSSRQQGTNYSAFAKYSLHTKRIPEMVFPGFLGYADTLQPKIHYWGWKLVDDNMPLILNIYFGLAVLVFASIGGSYRQKNNSHLPCSIRIYLFALFWLSFLLSLGRFVPFFSLLYHYIPFITLFRYPIKALLGGILPLALLAGYGSEIYFGSSHTNTLSNHADETQQKVLTHSLQPSWKMLSVFWGLFVVLFLLTIMFRISDGLATRFLHLYFQQVDGEIARQGIQASLIHTIAFWAVITLLFQYRRYQKRKWQHWLIAGILVVDLLLAGRRINPYAPEAFFTDIPDIVPVIHNEIGEGRIFRAPVPQDLTLQVPSNEAMWIYRWKFEVLDLHLASFYKLPVIFHGDFVGLSPSYLAKLQRLVDELPWERKLPLLSAGTVTVILSSEKPSTTGLSAITEISNRSNLSFYLYRNKTAAKRVNLVTNWKVVSSDDEALQIMLSSKFDPRTYVVLRRSEGISEFPDEISRLQHSRTTNSGVYDQQKAEINIINSESTSLQLSVSNNQDGYLVFSEPFYPGWKVYVDGKSVPVLRANLAFSAVFLQAGEHEVERYYRPYSLLLGTLSSLVCCAVLILTTLKGRILTID